MLVIAFQENKKMTQIKIFMKFMHTKTCFFSEMCRSDKYSKINTDDILFDKASQNDFNKEISLWNNCRRNSKFFFVIGL